MTSLHGGLKELANRQEDWKAVMSNQLLTAQVQQALAHLPKPSSVAEDMPSTPSPPVAAPAVTSSPACLTPPEKFSGELGDCQPFITDCECILNIRHKLSLQKELRWHS